MTLNEIIAYAQTHNLDFDKPVYHQHIILFFSNSFFD